jgi:hypothetical protein
MQGVPDSELQSTVKPRPELPNGVRLAGHFGLKSG